MPVPPHQRVRSKTRTVRAAEIHFFFLKKTQLRWLVLSSYKTAPSFTKQFGFLKLDLCTIDERSTLDILMITHQINIWCRSNLVVFLQVSRQISESRSRQDRLTNLALEFSQVILVLTDSLWKGKYFANIVIPICFLLRQLEKIICKALIIQLLTWPL